MYNAKCRHRALSFFAEQSVTSAERSVGDINIQLPCFAIDRKTYQFYCSSFSVTTA